MSNADVPRSRGGRTLGRRKATGGHTFIEATIVTLLVGMASVVVYGAINATQQADRYIAALTTATERGQRTAFEVARLVGESRKLFQEDAIGRAYLEALDLSDLPLAPGARLPSIDEEDAMDTDEVLEPRTGNCLLFVKEIDPSPAVANPTTGKVLHIDTYRFICVYPTATAQTFVPGRPNAKDLVVWRSTAFPSWAQISEIADATERKNVLVDLFKRYGYRHAWNAGEGVATSFFQFDGDGVLEAAATANLRIPEDRRVSDRGRLAYARVQLARTRDDTFAERTVLSQDDAAVWVPDGFEVKITGAVRSRKVWIHLVVEAPASGDRSTAVYPASVIVNCQDL